MLSRRSLFATAAAVMAATAAAQAAPCDHDMVSVGTTGWGDGNYLVCRSCRLERVEVHGHWRGDKRPEGILSPAQFAEHYAPLPTRAKLDRAIRAHL